MLENFENLSKNGRRAAERIKNLKSIIEQIRRKPKSIRDLGFSASTAYNYAHFLKSIGVARDYQKKLAWIDYDPLEESIFQLLNQKLGFRLRKISRDENQLLIDRLAAKYGHTPSDIERPYYRALSRVLRLYR